MKKMHMATGAVVTVLSCLALAAGGGLSVNKARASADDTGTSLDEESDVSDLSYSDSSSSLTLTLASGGSYLCGLSDSDIDGVISYYSAPMTRSQLLPYVAAPFSCQNYGDLCNLMGATRGEQYVCNIWNDLLAHTALTTATTHATTDFDVKNRQWFDALFPSGAPDNAAYFGVIEVDGDPVYSDACELEREDCSGAIETEENASNNRRVRSQAFYTPLGVYNEIGNKVTAYTKATGALKIGSVNVQSNFHMDSFNGMGRCDDDCGTDNATSGQVTSRDKDWFGWPQERIHAYGESSTYSVQTNCVTITAIWSHC